MASDPQALGAQTNLDSPGGRRRQSGPHGGSVHGLERRGRAAPTALEINARNQGFSTPARGLLAASDFTEIFGFEPGQTIELVLDDEAP